LGVNIDHVATLRQARGTTYPCPVEAARLCAEAGAESITLHLREDRRHIQDADVHAMMTGQSLPVNLEMANVAEIVLLAETLKPAEVCLVPERREELTTEGGLDVRGQQVELTSVVGRLNDAGILVSMFIAPDEDQIAASLEVGAAVIELHTGTFCDTTGAERQQELNALIHAAEVAHAAGLRVNAGHGINLENVGELLQVPHMHTLNIGHSLVARSVMVGLGEAVREMLRAMADYTKG
jgi:pyridoxine 5-phosphate synthase